MPEDGTAAGLVHDPVTMVSIVIKCIKYIDNS
jgi:hypothetical protein